MDTREERGFLVAVSYATCKGTRKAEVYLPGDVYRAITRAAVLDQGGVQRLPHITYPTVMKFLADPGMGEATREISPKELPLLVGIDSHGGDLFEEVSGNAIMPFDDMF